MHVTHSELLYTHPGFLGSQTLFLLRMNPLAHFVQLTFDDPYSQIFSTWIQFPEPVTL